MGVSLQRTVLLALAGSVLLALVPAAIALDRRLVAALEDETRRDLALAAMVLEDRDRARAEAMKMHAMDLAGRPNVGRALIAGRAADAVRAATDAAAPGERAVLIDATGRWLAGPAPDSAVLAAARTEAGALVYGFADGELFAYSLFPVMLEDTIGWGGVAAPLDSVLAATLADITGSDVIVLAPSGERLASTLEPATAGALSALAGADLQPKEVRSVRVAAGRYWISSVGLRVEGRLLFARSAVAELALLPGLRRAAGVGGLIALALAQAAGAVLAAFVARPVRQLARAADRLAEGDFDAPLTRSNVREVDLLADAFARMRSALQSQLRELARANQALEERQARLAALQAEMIQRDRLVASQRLIAELAHEIRNPVANVRNCLEVIHRRAGDDVETREFADLAIDELLRMHELAEQLLDLNRPLDAESSSCNVRAVAENVAQLYAAGAANGRWPLQVQGDAARMASIRPDTLKQVLLNLVENAREAMPAGGGIDIIIDDDGKIIAVEVLDRGDGVPAESLPHVFDAFFTTKRAAHGVGLGLFLAQGLVRRAGGRILVANREPGPGACFRIELPGTEAA